MVSFTFNNQIIFMRYIKFYFSLFIIIGFIISSCSKLQDNISPPETIVSVHGSGVLQKGSADFHGLKVAQNGFSSCEVCHGVNFSGGTSAVSCVNCHTGITVHKTGDTEADPHSPDFHGNLYIKSNWNLARNVHNVMAFHIQAELQVHPANTCHKNPGGPEACNTCHGNLTNTTQISPPKRYKRKYRYKIRRGWSSFYTFDRYYNWSKCFM